MPDFYQGVGSGPNSFSQGLMAGYQFIDNINQRKEEAKQRARTITLAEAANTRAEAEAGRSAERFNIEKDDRTREIETNAERRLAALTASRVQARGGKDKLTAEDRADLIREGRAADSDTAGMDDDGVFNAVMSHMDAYDPRGAQIEAGNREVADAAAATEYAAGLSTPRPQPVASGPPSSGPSAPSPGAPAPAATSGSLADVGTQTYQSQLPSDLDTTVPASARQSNFAHWIGGGRREAPKPAQREIPQMLMKSSDDPRRPATPVRPLTDEELSDEVAKDPSGYAASWMDRRNKIKDVDLVAKTDAVVGQELQRRYDTARVAFDNAKRGTADFGIASQALKTYDTQLGALAKARGDQAVDDAMPRGSLGPGDRRTAAAQAAVSAYTQAPSAPITDAQERRILTTVNRAASRPGEAASPVVLKQLALAEAKGYIPKGSTANWAKYGTIEKPEDPKWQVLGNGYAVRTVNGVDQLKYFPAQEKSGDGKGGAGGGNVWGADNERARTGMENAMARAFGKKEKDPEVGKHMNGLYVLLTGPNLPGLEILRQRGLVDESGNFDPALMDDRDQAVIANAYAKYYDKDVNSIWRSLRQDWSLADRAVEAQTGSLPEQPVLSSPTIAPRGRATRIQ